MSSFNTKIRKAIRLFGDLGEGVDDKDVWTLLINNDMTELEATEIFIFLPIAFCRRLLPMINWLDNYYEVNGKNEKIEKKFSETESFRMIWKATCEYFITDYNKLLALKIASRSSEFDAINKIFKDGGKLENIDIFPMVIYK